MTLSKSVGEWNPFEARKQLSVEVGVAAAVFTAKGLIFLLSSPSFPSQSDDFVMVLMEMTLRQIAFSILRR